MRLREGGWQRVPRLALNLGEIAPRGLTVDLRREHLGFSRPVSRGNWLILLVEREGLEPSTPAL
jgi:hypothetical protein